MRIDRWTRGRRAKPAIPSAADDPDGDSLPTAFELQIGSDPNNPHIDSEGVPDGAEVKGYPNAPSAPIPRTRSYGLGWGRAEAPPVFADAVS